jgi:hypothetical protein
VQPFAFPNMRIILLRSFKKNFWHIVFCRVCVHLWRPSNVYHTCWSVIQRDIRTCRETHMYEDAVHVCFCAESGLVEYHVLLMLLSPPPVCWGDLASYGQWIVNTSDLWMRAAYSPSALNWEAIVNRMFMSAQNAHGEAQLSPSPQDSQWKRGHEDGVLWWDECPQKKDFLSLSLTSSLPHVRTQGSHKEVAPWSLTSRPYNCEK